MMQVLLSYFTEGTTEAEENEVTCQDDTAS